MAISEIKAKERTGYLGGSDIAAVLGLSRWRTPLQLWGEKTGNIIPEDISGKLHVRLGNKLEQTVCDLFQEETGKKVARVNDTLIHPVHSFLRGNIDRRIVGEKAVLEAKTTSAWNAKQWEGEEIPQEYLIQTYFYMELMGADRGYVACLIGNQDFRVKVLERDDVLQKQMIEKAVDFWTRYIVPKVMPSFITSKDADTLYNLFPLGEEGEPIELGDEANALIESIQAAKEDAKAIETLKDKQENELRVLLKEHAEGFTDKFKVTWKNQKTRRMDLPKMRIEVPEICAKYAETTESRVLRIAPLKKTK
jgi:putative phage-type endonuclease